MNPAGSTRRTRPRIAGPPPQPAMSTGKPGCHLHRIGRKKVADNFELMRISHLDERRARGDRRLALLMDPQHGPVNRRAQQYRAAVQG